MSLGAPSPPSVQSPDTTASNQEQYNLQTAAAQQAGSDVNQETPFGSLTYNQTGTGPSGIPLYTATTSLSPQIQSIYNSLMGQTGQTLTGADYGAQDPATVIGNATSGNTQALLGQETSYLDPFFNTQTSQLDTQLKNQGLEPGTPGYDNAMRANAANQNQAVTGFLAQAEPAAYQQAETNYTMPLSIASQELGLLNPSEATSSLVNPPQTQLQAPNYTQAVSDYNTANMNAYNAQVQSNSNMMSGLFGIPTAILGGWARSPSGGAAITSALT